MRRAAIILSLLFPLILAAVTPERQRKADYYFMEALAREAAGDSDDAYLLLRRSVELDSVSSTVPAGMLGGRMMGLSRGDSALFNAGLRLLERHVQANPTDLYAGFNLALNYERIGRTDRVLATWAMLDSLNPENSSVLWRRSGVEARYGSAEEALRLMDRVETLEGISPEIVMQQTRLMLQNGDTAAATARIDAMLEAMPADAQARVFAAAYYEAIGQDEVADSFIDRALELDSSNGAAYYQRARRYKDEGRDAEYFKEIATAIKLEDLDRESKLGLVADYLNEFADSLNRRDEIDLLLNELLGQYTHDEEVRRYVSGYYLGIGDYSRAAEQLMVVADMNHEDPQARRLLGIALAQEKQLPEALAAFKEAMVLTPEEEKGQRSDLLTSMGDVWQQMEMPDSVVAAYERAIALDSNNDLALNNYAYFLAVRNRELSRAEQMSSKSMQIRPGLATYLDTYAWIQFKLGDYQQAKQYIDTALLRAGSDLSAELLEHAGDISFMLGRTEQALDYWTDALELEPDNAALKRKVETGKIEE